MTTRLTACLLALAVVLGGVLLLRPSESTLAAWSDEATVAVPQLRTGGVQVDVTGSGTTATLGMSGDTSGTWRPAAVTVLSAGRALTGAELAGSRVEYRLARNGACVAADPVAYSASPSGTATSFPVTGGERLSGAHTVCLTFVPSDQVLVQLGGRALSFVTTVDGVAAPTGTWTAANTWTASHTLPAAPTVSALRCTPGWLNQWVTLGWDWDGGDAANRLARFSLQLQDRGTWRDVATISSRARTTTITPYQFSFVSFDSYTLRVVAVLNDGTTVPTSSTTNVRVERVGLGAAYCS
ncbi:hypothetical protein [Georgenia satyanarayanai]|uniref:hypothetical protein n=1 Tax=Georgenia satyanarayanai TaxID=860221 RepID=UPI001264A9E9|nr:hypothetical protein [Georgenia satyanarayanai]